MGYDGFPVDAMRAYLHRAENNPILSHTHMGIFTHAIIRAGKEYNVHSLRDEGKRISSFGCVIDLYLHEAS